MRGKVHELSDDLESHFFVLLFEALYFVEHNKLRDISPEKIFNQIAIDPRTGNPHGGMGKMLFYTTGFCIVKDQLEFTSKPFTTLIRGLYLLFSSLCDHHVRKCMKRAPYESNMKNVRELEGCVGVVALFEEALKSTEWPTKCDKVPDQYPSTNRSEPEQKDSVALSHFDKPPVPEPSCGKRKRQAEGENRRSSGDKRPKVSPHTSDFD